MQLSHASALIRSSSGPRAPSLSARASSGGGRGHHSQSGDLTLMGFDRKEATRFAMPHNICNLPLPSVAMLRLLSARAHARTCTRRVAAALSLFCAPSSSSCHPIIRLSPGVGCRFLFAFFLFFCPLCKTPQIHFPPF